MVLRLRRGTMSETITPLSQTSCNVHQHAQCSPERVAPSYDELAAAAVAAAAAAEAALSIALSTLGNDGMVPCRRLPLPALLLANGDVDDARSSISSVSCPESRENRRARARARLCALTCRRSTAVGERPSSTISYANAERAGMVTRACRRHTYHQAQRCDR